MTARAGSPQASRSVHFTLSHDVDSFINTGDASIWPCKLPSFHKQLKNYISTTTKDVIYYVSSNEVYAIHIPTNRQELLVSLGFNPTCIASGYGWVCLGGYDHGRCAFIDMRKCPPFETSPTLWSAEVDDLLPLARESLGMASLQDSLPRRQRPKVIHEEIGTQIVNGITVSQFVQDGDDLPDETLAVLSNNDKTVTIYSLTQQTRLKSITLTKEINHASLSPDGEFLVAVGDVNKVWFYRRSTRKRSNKQPSYDWDEVAVIRLVSTSEFDWSFATAWSPSGHICMIASQFGVLTVFETSRIKQGMDHSDAIIHTFKSSRPYVCDPQSLIPSAPRSLAFSPEPWDLVAWAEDHGRVTIADLRDAFASRQTIEVDVYSDKLHRITQTPTSAPRRTEQGREATLIQQHQEALEANDPEAAIQRAAEYIEDAASRRRSRSSAMYGTAQELPQSMLSESERELMQLIRNEHARDNLGPSSSTQPYSINYYNRNLENASSSTTPLTFGQYMLNRTASGHTSSSWSTPRRRGSVGMSANNPERAGRTSAAHPSSLTPGPPVPLSASPSRLSDTGGNDTEMQDQDMPSQQTTTSSSVSQSTPPHTSNQDTLRPRNRLPNEILRLAHARGLDRDRVTDTMLRWRSVSNTISTLNSETRDLNETDAVLREQARAWGRRIHELRARAGLLSENFAATIGGNDDMSFLDDVTNDIVIGRETISRTRQGSQRAATDREVSIQGIGWSWDGRWLIVGTAEGIMKYKVNIPARMRTPSLTVR